VALKDADFQALDGVGRPSNQMRIAAALAAAKRCNKFVILHKKGMLFHSRPNPTYKASAEPARHPRRQLRTPPSRSPDNATMVRTEDGK
jgi:hypothetical protein